MKCQFKACNSDNEATLSPVLLIYAPKPYNVPCRASLSIAVCGECSWKMTLEDLIIEDSWERICAGFFKAGKMQPDRSRTRLAFESIVHREEQFKEMQKPGQNIIEA